jgi:hypothetical protein
MGVFVWLEQTSFAQWVHGSDSVMAFPMFLTAHVIGMGLLVGLATVVNLRLLGYIRQVPLAPLAKLFPLMWAGFCVNAISGFVLFIADASTKLATPIFYIKLVLVTLGMLSLAAIRSDVFKDSGLDKVPVSGKRKLMAGASLLFWAGALTSARLIAYLQPRHAASLYKYLFLGG